jgi:hypothetical protein
VTAEKMACSFFFNKIPDTKNTLDRQRTHEACREKNHFCDWECSKKRNFFRDH